MLRKDFETIVASCAKKIKHFIGGKVSRGKKNSRYPNLIAIRCGVDTTGPTLARCRLPRRAAGIGSAANDAQEHHATHAAAAAFQS